MTQWSAQSDSRGQEKHEQESGLQGLATIYPIIIDSSPTSLPPRKRLLVLKQLSRFKRSLTSATAHLCPLPCSDVRGPPSLNFGRALAI